jgi:hypothetical protein
MKHVQIEEEAAATADETLSKRGLKARYRTELSNVPIVIRHKLGTPVNLQVRAGFASPGDLNLPLRCNLPF